MSDTTPASTLRRDLRAIWVDGMAFTVMVGMGETYIPAFALAVGLSDVFAGLIATLPMLAGSLLQLVSPYWIARLGSHRRWVATCAALQAASFLPMVVAALLGSISAPWLFLLAAVYWGAGLATGPAWNTWIDSLVPARVRIRYFARRTRILHLMMIVGMSSAGWILQAGSGLDEPLWAFALIFSFACIARALSSFILARQSEPEPLVVGVRSVGIGDFLARFRGSRDGRLLAYMLSVQVAVQVASPYFTPYMLGPLHLSYARYMILIATAILAKFASLPLYGWFAGRFGVRALLWFGGIGIVPSSALWLVSDSFVYLFAAQVFAGFVWAAYELATFLLFFDSIDARERTSVLTTFNAANALAINVGALCGGALLRSLGGTEQAFLGLFAISFAMRMATILFLRRVDPSRSEPSGSRGTPEALHPAPETSPGSSSAGM